MEFLINYWVIIIISVALITAGSYEGYKFYKKPSEEQITKVKEWLLYAVALAERELGSGTGQIKLRIVYDMFITKFPYLVKIISFAVFSSYVDEALIRFKKLLESNQKLQDYVKGE